jgi:1,4-alpha-glucan branching enzyme
VPDAEDYRIILDTDNPRFEGFGRVDADATYWKQDQAMYGRRQTIQVYLPNRSAQVLGPVTLP